MKNYYEILGVSPNSETEVITAAYKAMMRKYHPDTNGSSAAAERAKEINEAYEVLKNPISRREYDAKMGHAESPAAQSPAAPAAPPPPPPPPPPTTSTQVSEPNSGGEKTPFIGERGELRVWTIFAAAYVAIALLYFGPTRISVSIGRSPLDLAAEIAGSALLPFGLGFAIAWLWRALSSSISEPKTDRKRWLAIQFVFIAILVFNKSMLEKAREDEAAATALSAPSSSAPVENAEAPPEAVSSVPPISSPEVPHIAESPPNPDKESETQGGEIFSDPAYDEGVDYLLNAARTAASDSFYANEYSKNGAYTQQDIIASLLKRKSEGPTGGNSYVVYKALMDGEIYPRCRKNGRVDDGCTDFDRRFDFAPNPSLASQIKRKKGCYNRQNPGC